MAAVVGFEMVVELGFEMVVVVGSKMVVARGMVVASEVAVKVVSVETVVARFRKSVVVVKKLAARVVP